jgi:hypothetical protein
MSCGICQETGNNIVKTPCNHEFHNDCIKNIVRPTCPLCKQDLTNFLINDIGLTQTQINNSIIKDNERILCDCLQDVSIFDILPEDLLGLSLVSKNNNPEWTYVYRDIIIDQVSNAEHFFCEISKLKHEKNINGLFVSCCDTEEFIINVLSGYKNGFLKWISLNELKTTNFYSSALNLHKRITNHQTEFAILMLFCDDTNDMYVCSKLFSIDPECKKEFASKTTGGGYVAGMTQNRISNVDMINTVVKCKTCRCSGQSSMSTNGEYTTMKKYLTNIKNKTKNIKKQLK